MAISTNYSTPVMVNGFSCRNCSEVDQAKKNIDPADPAGGPFGINSTKAGARQPAHKAAPVDRVALEQAHKRAAETQGSAILRAYAAPGSLAPFLQRSA